MGRPRTEGAAHLHQTSSLAMARQIRITRRRPRGESGAAAIEFALVVMIMLTVVSAVFEFGRTWNEVEVLTSAAREGARVAAIGRTTDETVAAVSDAADPYSIDGPVAITVDGVTAGSTPCEESKGAAVAVSWTQQLQLQILGLPVFSPTREFRGVFRCEL